MYAPPLRAVTFLFTGIKHFWNDYVFLLHVRGENQQLRTSLDLLTEQNVQRQELLLENDRLRKLLLLKERSSAKLISAEVIGRDAIGWLKTILINKGENDNVYKDQAVVTHQGIVGRCIEVADTTSRVLLITDINSSVDALVQRTRSRGIVEGTGSGMCELKYIPKGLPIGTVKDIKKSRNDLFQSVELVPSSNLNKLEEISLLLPAGD
jgi:rod shape-determining protein MreC